MRDLVILLIHLIVTLFQTARPESEAAAPAEDSATIPTTYFACASAFAAFDRLSHRRT